MSVGPEVTAADHCHQPTEVYRLMTHGAQWRLDKGDWFDVMFGDLIFHDVRQMHATRTHDRSFLAFAGWLEAGDRYVIQLGA